MGAGDWIQVLLKASVLNHWTVSSASQPPTDGNSHILYEHPQPTQDALLGGQHSAACKSSISPSWGHFCHYLVSSNPEYLTKHSKYSNAVNSMCVYLSLSLPSSPSQNQRQEAMIMAPCCGRTGRWEIHTCWPITTGLLAPIWGGGLHSTPGPEVSLVPANHALGSQEIWNS